ncbi:MAG: thiamine pyrophosphate-dependent enzyme [Candidatus Bipolaricaulota bacterium]
MPLTTLDEKPQKPQDVQTKHPMEKYLRPDRLPHIWCSGCGLGTALNAYCHALDDEGFGLDDFSVVSGIGCTGRVAGYVASDSYHTTHGRAIPFATGLKLANPDINVTVFSGDGDLFSIGGNHFIHAARRNIDLSVICVNNYTYGMTGGQVAPTTPKTAMATTAPYGNFERPFNLPNLAASAGAVYVARWTSLHVRRMKKAFQKILTKKGFTFVEVISPCPTGFGRKNGQGEALDELKSYKERSVIRDGADPTEVDIEMDPDADIVVGTFVDKEKSTYSEVKEQQLTGKV